MKKEVQTNIAVKQINRKRVFDLLYHEGPLTKMDVMQRLNMSLPTVIQDIRELLSQDLIRESGYLPSSGGRKAVMLSCNPSAKYSIGLDVTKEHISIVIVDLTGQAIYSDGIDISFSNTDAYFQRAGELVQRALEMQEIPAERVLGVGIAVPAIVSPDMRHIDYATVVDFSGGKSSVFEKYIPFKCMLCNDSNAGGIAEMWMNTSIKNAFYISVSNSVGGAFLIDHNIFPGENQRCAEVGHMTIVPDGQRCYCGEYGCMDAYCNTRILSESANKSLSGFFSLLRQGSSEHRQLWTRYLNYLSIAINNLHMLFDCNVIIGGYLGAYIGDYMDELKQLVASRNTFKKSSNYLQVCRYKGEAAAVGAALLHLKAFLDQI